MRYRFGRPTVIVLLLTAGLATAPVAGAAASRRDAERASLHVRDGASLPSSKQAAGGGGVRPGWPCPGCLLLIPPGYDATHPSALLIALHGDEGTPGPIAEVLSRVTQARNVILFAPQCPTALGCRLVNGSGFTNSWWGWLQYSSTYADGWLGRQIDRIQAIYSVDSTREYVFGWSGGADYLGWYALQNGARFAAVAFVAGGVPYSQSCPSNRLPAEFLLGTADPRYQSAQPLQVKAVFDRCGDQTRLVRLTGVDHAGTMTSLDRKSFATSFLGWLLRQRRQSSRTR